MDDNPTAGLRDAEEQVSTATEASPSGVEGAAPGQNGEDIASPPRAERRPRFREREGSFVQRRPPAVSATPRTQRTRGLVAALVAVLLVLGVAANALFNHSGTPNPTATALPGATVSSSNVPALAAEASSALNATALVPPDGKHLNDPHEAIVGPGGLIYVADPGASAVVVFNAHGTYLRSITSADGALKQPFSLAMGADGHLYVLDSIRARIFDFAGPDNRFVRSIGSDITIAKGRGLAIGPGGTLFVVNPANNSLDEYDPQGTLLKQHIPPLGAALGQFNQPSAVTVASSGAVFVLDNINVRIEEFNPALDGVGQWPAPATDTFHSAHILAVTPTRFLVSDGQGSLLDYNLATTPATIRRHSLLGVTGIVAVGLARLDAGHLLVTDARNRAVWRVPLPAAGQ